jgi:hypothetical protein
MVLFLFGECRAGCINVYEISDIVYAVEFLGFLASIGIAVAAVKYIAIGTPLIGIVLYFLQQFYLRTSRQLRLLESVITHLIVRLPRG